MRIGKLVFVFITFTLVPIAEVLETWNKFNFDLVPVEAAANSIGNDL